MCTRKNILNIQCKVKHTFKINNLSIPSLGMPHDAGPMISSKCPKYEHIMAIKQHYGGQTTWSKCSQEVAESLWDTKQCLRDSTEQENSVDAYVLDHSRYHDVPGREWTAKAQCELFLHDRDANVITLHDICKFLLCERPTIRNRYFSAGPALDGTNCALGKECHGGECMPVLESPYIVKHREEDNWSKWNKSTCQSSCLENSKGVIVKRRSCKHGAYATPNCKGSYYNVDVCDDSKLCVGGRKKLDEFTRNKCSEFSSILDGGKYFTYKLEKDTGGQVSHDVEEPWIACIIFCQIRNTSMFVGLHQDVFKFGINTYFPDGTWCHYGNGQDYYCRQHYCLPENYLINE